MPSRIAAASRPRHARCRSRRRRRAEPSGNSRAGSATLLFRRTTRSVGLTPEGEAFLERARRVLTDLDDAEKSIRGEDAAPRGILHITAPVVFGRMHILPVVTGLLHAHPALDVRLSLTDRVVRLVEEGLDAAVRIGELPDSALHAVKLTETRRVLAASPAYLAAHGEPRAVAELHNHALIATDALATGSEWRFGVAGGLALKIKPRFLTDSVEAAIDAALRDVGIVRALSYQVEDHVRAGRLRIVLAGVEPPAAPVQSSLSVGKARICKRARSGRRGAGPSRDPRQAPDRVSGKLIDAKYRDDMWRSRCIQRRSLKA